MDESHTQKIEEGTGTINGHMLVYKRGKFLGLFGGENVEIEFNQKKLIPSKKRMIAYYEFDGFSITQLSMKDLGELSVSAEFNTLYELGKITEESGLKPPPSLAKILEWLVIGVLLITAIMGIYQGSQIHNALTPLAKGINKSVEGYQQFGAYTANVCVLALKTSNATLQYVNASNRALGSKLNP